MSTIDEATLLAYLRCHYRVHGEAPFTLRIGERNEALAQLYGRLGCDCAAFPSAWNPHGEPQDEVTNKRAQDALQRELAARGYTCVPGIGEDPGGHWRGEESVLVAGMALDEAVAIALACGQNALVWCGADARPQLILLR